MSSIVVERGAGSRADRRQLYNVVIDGQRAGTIKSRQTLTILVSPGVYSVRFTMGLQSSLPVKVHVDSGPVRLRCESRRFSLFGLLSHFGLGSAIQVAMREPPPDPIAMRQPAPLFSEPLPQAGD